MIITYLRGSVCWRNPDAAMNGKENMMGPPATIPDKAKFLRKSKSTNTLKLPKRDEASKPGYCESCRQKFEDFREVRWP